MKDTTYIQTCVDTNKNQNYLWTMATNGNYANYGRSTEYRTLNESEAKTGSFYGLPCNKMSYYPSRSQIQYNLEQKAAKRYNNSCNAQNGMCPSREYSAFETPMLNNSNVLGPLNNYGWDSYSLPNSTSQIQPSIASSYSNFCAGMPSRRC